MSRAAVLFLFLSTLAAPRASSEVLILVPGTVNSYVPGGSDPEELRAYPYFSKAVVDTVQAEGYESCVVHGLDPFGGLEANGKKALADARAWYLARHPRADEPVTLLGHSAGGLYALYLAAHRGELPVRKIIMVSTPLEGTRLASVLLRGGPAAQKLWDKLLAYRPYLDLSGLAQMRPAEVAKFLAGIALDPSIRLFAVGGSQPLPRGPLQATDPDFLSPPFALAGAAMGVESDGIVDTESAWGRRAVIPTLDGKAAEIVALTAEKAALEHPEQFMDYRLLPAFGTRGAWVIEGRQRGFYSRLLRAAR